MHDSALWPSSRSSSSKGTSMKHWCCISTKPVECEPLGGEVWEVKTGFDAKEAMDMEGEEGGDATGLCPLFGEVGRGTFLRIAL